MCHITVLVAIVYNSDGILEKRIEDRALIIPSPVETQFGNINDAMESPNLLILWKKQDGLELGPEAMLLRSAIFPV